MCTWNNEKETVLFIWASFSSEKFSLAVYDFCDVLFEKTGLHVPCLHLYSDKAVINAIFFQMSHMENRELYYEQKPNQVSRG